MEQKNGSRQPNGRHPGLLYPNFSARKAFYSMLSPYPNAFQNRKRGTNKSLFFERNPINESATALFSNQMFDHTSYRPRSRVVIRHYLLLVRFGITPSATERNQCCICSIPSSRRDRIDGIGNFKVRCDGQAISMSPLQTCCIISMEQAIVHLITVAPCRTKASTAIAASWRFDNVWVLRISWRIGIDVRSARKVWYWFASCADYILDSIHSPGSLTEVTPLRRYREARIAILVVIVRVILIRAGRFPTCNVNNLRIIRVVQYRPLLHMASMLLF